jgi:hypothetical protein
MQTTLSLASMTWGDDNSKLIVLKRVLERMTDPVKLKRVIPFFVPERWSPEMTELMVSHPEIAKRFAVENPELIIGLERRFLDDSTPSGSTARSKVLGVIKLCYRAALEKLLFAPPDTTPPQSGDVLYHATWRYYSCSGYRSDEGVILHPDDLRKKLSGDELWETEDQRPYFADREWELLTHVNEEFVTFLPEFEQMEEDAQAARDDLAEEDENEWQEFCEDDLFEEKEDAEMEATLDEEDYEVPESLLKLIQHCKSSVELRAQIDKLEELTITDEMSRMKV